MPAPRASGDSALPSVGAWRPSRTSCALTSLSSAVRSMTLRFQLAPRRLLERQPFALADQPEHDRRDHHRDAEQREPRARAGRPQRRLERRQRGELAPSSATAIVAVPEAAFPTLRFGAGEARPASGASGRSSNWRVRAISAFSSGRSVRSRWNRHSGRELTITTSCASDTNVAPCCARQARFEPVEFDLDHDHPKRCRGGPDPARDEQPGPAADRAEREQFGRSARQAHR